MEAIIRNALGALVATLFLGLAQTAAAEYDTHAPATAAGGNWLMTHHRAPKKRYGMQPSHYQDAWTEGCGQQ